MNVGANSTSPLLPLKNRWVAPPESHKIHYEFERTRAANVIQLFQRRLPIRGRRCSKAWSIWEKLVLKWLLSFHHHENKAAGHDHTFAHVIKKRVPNVSVISHIMKNKTFRYDHSHLELMTAS